MQEFLHLKYIWKSIKVVVLILIYNEHFYYRKTLKNNWIHLLLKGLFNDKILAAILFVYVCPSLIKLQAEWLPVPSFSLRPNSRHYDGVEFLTKCLLGAVSWKCRQNNNLSRKCRQKCAHFVLWTGLLTDEMKKKFFVAFFLLVVICSINLSWNGVWKVQELLFD